METNSQKGQQDHPTATIVPTGHPFEKIRAEPASTRQETIRSVRKHNWPDGRNKNRDTHEEGVKVSNVPTLRLRAREGKCAHKCCAGFCVRPEQKVSIQRGVFVG